ncbi:MAG: prepilin-type N-terminal cleavage/methylation domain-containing protein [bacterium]
MNKSGQLKKLLQAVFAKGKKPARAFTLIELLVAISAFTVIIVAVSNIFISGMKNQKYALLSQRLLDQTSFVMEFMSRSLRMARKEVNLNPGNQCLTYGHNYEKSIDGTSLKFINHLDNDDCQRFFLENGQLKYERKINTALPEVLILTSDKIEIVDLKFELIGELQTDYIQPRVVVAMNLRWKSPTAQERRAIKIQTVLSQRNLDIVY